ncbi:hypothetical protein M2901_02385 [Vagococcus lutrae]|uniref:lipopolysaccharide biosynthesis protein n=1 Tax=Vagococcus lutrae TaxID=81947 RepID=UPI00200E5B50|nr:hypothetical protein [Vagococcus lutrae]UQF71506.1 hypothetical protein M2901_02385 [Vagococcus lutrae]
MKFLEKIKSISLIMGNLIFAASQFIMLSLVAKNYNKIELGYFTLSLSITAPIFMFLQMNYRTIYATSKEGQISFKKLSKMTLVQSFFALIISCVITLILYNDLILVYIVCCIGLSKLVEGNQEVIYGKYQKNGDIYSIALSKGLRGLLSIFVTILNIYIFKQNIIITSLSYFIAWLLTFLIVDFKTILLDEVRVLAGLSIKNVLKMGIPLGLTVFLDSLIVNSPRYYVSLYIGVREVGYFSSLLYFMNLGQIIVTSVIQTYISDLSRYIDTSFRNYLNLKRKLLVMSILIGSVVILIPLFFSNILLPLVFDSSFLQYKTEFVLIMIAAAIWYIAGIYYACILATRKFQKQSVIFLSTFIVMQSLLKILVPVYGVRGACFSLILAYLFRLVISMAMLRNIEKKFFIK